MSGVAITGRVLPTLPPALVTRDLARPAATAPRRTKLWEFSTNLHCSIIGTCLSTGELRQVLRKLGVAAPDSTDHELHGTAVRLAARHDKPAKLLHKALDERHRLAINRFAKVGTEAELRALWREAARSGEIPGAYWATLTHPAATHALIRDAFGEVHMLSHLVGAANRADIRRLCQLEADKAALQAKLQRQQDALRDAIVSRDVCIRELRQALAQRVVAEPAADGGDAVLHQLVIDLERRLAGETRRRAALEERLTAANAACAEERSARAQTERDNAALRRELEAIEGVLHEGCGAETPPEIRLDGSTILYVGGRPHQVAHLRAVAENAGASFLHHDGGIEHHLNLLAGLTSQATLVVFPVDCISHHAAQVAKQLCRQTGKRFIPLRSSSVTSLLAALRQPNLAEAAD